MFIYLFYTFLHARASYSWRVCSLCLATSSTLVTYQEFIHIQVSHVSVAIITAHGLMHKKSTQTQKKWEDPIACFQKYDSCKHCLFQTFISLLVRCDLARLVSRKHCQDIVYVCVFVWIIQQGIAHFSNHFGDSHATRCWAINMQFSSHHLTTTYTLPVAFFLSLSLYLSFFFFCGLNVADTGSNKHVKK